MNRPDDPFYHCKEAYKNIFPNHVCGKQIDEDCGVCMEMEKSNKVKIQKYSYPKLEVFYKEKFVDYIENEYEFYLFRLNMIDNSEYDFYFIKTPKGKKVKIDKYGCFDYCEELEELNKLLASIIQKQMNLRIKDVDLQRAN